MVVKVKYESEKNAVSVFLLFLALTFDEFVGHGGNPLERQKQDSHVYRKTATLNLIFPKNQSRHHINKVE